MAVDEVASIVGALAFAASQRTLVETHAEPWTFGWCVEAHRRSPCATIRHRGNLGASLSPDGVRAYESAMFRILRHPVVVEQWDSEEIWGEVASLVGAAPLTSEREELQSHIESSLRQVLKRELSVVSFPIANVKWESPPQAFGELVIGIVNETWVELVGSQLSCAFHIRTPPWWFDTQPDSRQSQYARPSIGAAVRVPSRSVRAIHQAEEKFNDLVNLALLFEVDLGSHELFSGRGSTNRPGVRGLTLHRPALDDLIDIISPEISRELSTDLLVVQGEHQIQSRRWFSSDPVPLDKLIASGENRDAIQRTLWAQTDTHKRLRTAARWHAKAHWSIDPNEEVLCLGIAFDALLGSPSGPQRRELSERFAYIHPTAAERENRFALFANEYYTARSEVAHGRRCTALDEPMFGRRMSRDVRVTANRLAAMIERWHIDTEAEFSRMFTALKWGRSPGERSGRPG